MCCNNVNNVESPMGATGQHHPVLKSSIFWDIMQCSPLKVNQCFRGTCQLPSSGSKYKTSKKKNSMKAGGRWLCLPPAFMLVSCSAHSLTWRWRRHVPPKCHLTFNRLHGIISQKTELFITTAVRTLNPTWPSVAK
jgi:hypothetical protein